jgi:hypothetical protein
MFSRPKSQYLLLFKIAFVDPGSKHKYSIAKPVILSQSSNLTRMQTFCIYFAMESASLLRGLVRLENLL